MDVYVAKPYLAELYQHGKTTDKKHRFQPDIIRRFIRVVDLLIELPHTTALMQYNSLRYEKLKGDKLGRSSVRVNDQYRIEFEEHTIEGQTLATICNIVELSNHYR